jgi:hypothetical protein
VGQATLTPYTLGNIRRAAVLVRHPILQAHDRCLRWGNHGNFVQRGKALLALHRHQDDLPRTPVNLTRMAHRRNVNRLGARGRPKKPCGPWLHRGSRASAAMQESGVSLADPSTNSA